MDKPLHTRLRDPLMAAFSPKRTQSLAPTVIADVEDLLDSIAALDGQTGLLQTLLKVEDAPRFNPKKGAPPLATHLID